MNGLLVIDKPGGITSRDAVNRVQTWLPPRTKIGHTGTLDPLATGVLVLCVGSATRLAEYVQGMDKTYETTVVLGARSDTDDADGTPTPTPDVTAVCGAAVRSALLRFVGEIEQTPPAYSAVKVAGRRAHELARRGAEVEIAPRPVRVYAIALRYYVWPELDLEVHCGKGTYIRSLARDLGEVLGCGAYVKVLRRTRVGPFVTAEGLSIDGPPANVRDHLRPPRAAVAHLPTLEIDEEAIRKWRNGHAFGSPDLSVPEGTEVAVADAHGHLVGVGRVDADGSVRPAKVFATDRN
jgi:tRNA pseudouridine55 synthase